MGNCTSTIIKCELRDTRMFELAEEALKGNIDYKFRLIISNIVNNNAIISAGNIDEDVMKYSIYLVLAIIRCTYKIEDIMLDTKINEIHKIIMKTQNQQLKFLFIDIINNYYCLATYCYQQINNTRGLKRKFKIIMNSYIDQEIKNINGNINDLTFKNYLYRSVADNYVVITETLKNINSQSQ